MSEAGNIVNATEPEVSKNYDHERLSITYAFFEKVCFVGVIYFGYINLSISWLIISVILFMMWNKWTKEGEIRRSHAKAVALASEKDVISSKLIELPAWVSFPDVERAEWLNRILIHVWPNFNHYIEAFIKEHVEPKVIKNLVYYKIYSFKFENCHLGSIPPRIVGVKVYDRNLSRNEIIMDIDLLYAGNCYIRFLSMGVKGEIKDFQIRGKLRVVMRPLITSMPLVGGLQIFFLDKPNIDFDLSFNFYKIDIRVLRDVLLRVIDSQVANMMVSPNIFPIKLSDEVSTCDLMKSELMGVLKIHVVEAKNLMKKDIVILGEGKSDPYGVISLDDQTFRTETIENNLNPKWNYWCEALVYSNISSKINIQLFDWDKMSADDPLGRCSVDISTIVEKGQLDTWLTLEEAEHGEIHLHFIWCKLSSKPSDLQTAIQETQSLNVNAMSTAVLIIYIDSCENLPNNRRQSKPDPYLEINIGKKTARTATEMQTLNPIYKIDFPFLIGNPMNDVINFKVIDEATGSKLGELDYNLSSLLVEENMYMDNQSLTLDKSDTESKIILSMRLQILNEADSEIKFNAETNSDTISISSSDTDNFKKNIATENRLLIEQKILKNFIPKALSTPALNYLRGPLKLLHRTKSTTSFAEEAEFSRIQMTLGYAIPEQRLIVVVHRIANIPLKGPSNIPDPYVKLYLLPERSKDSKRKTVVLKDNSNPVYEKTFEYIMSQGEFNSQSLEVTVCSQKGFLAGGSSVIGQVIINLSELYLTEPKTMWFDLE